jgi:hypothetical protein
MREIAGMVTMKMGDEYFIHPAHRNTHGIILGCYARSTVKNKLITTAYFHKNTVAFLR